MINDLLLIDIPICRYCFSQENIDDIIFSPCKCTGDKKFTHKECLVKLFILKNKEVVITCKFKLFNFSYESCKTIYSFKFIETVKENKSLYLDILLYFTVITMILMLNYVFFGYIMDKTNIFFTIQVII